MGEEEVEALLQEAKADIRGRIKYFGKQTVFFIAVACLFATVTSRLFKDILDYIVLFIYLILF